MKLSSEVVEVDPSQYSLLLFNFCPLCEGLLDSYNSMKYCNCNRFGHPQCVTKYMKGMSSKSIECR